ncbi:BamA/TamA family outer membrane protein [Hymenobacter sp. BT491]|uniref:BamA/TamA family outer membrane protein n=1 Tax=Hymenobacter sp. BT491 TaxID=2766779 RepID=UPI0016536183|nr:BamA/TamA family outer membrane protein [Hymenobacter sp. BT491]MBC6991404.1 BamA/TamA family outer membrane protein [Hymenobacter sp. BT491]
MVRAQCPEYATLRVATILFVGNEVTKERVLRAELDIHEGDTLPATSLAKRLEANRRRIFNLQLFHSVGIQTVCRNGDITILFGVQERWYLFPVPIFSLADRNFRSWLDRRDRWQRVDYGLHVVRSNFRGRNEQVTANLQLGFNKKYELFYEAPGYGRRRRVGFGGGVSYYRSRALDYDVVSDRLVNFREHDIYPIERQYVTAGVRWRHTVQRLTAFDVSYHQERISDSIQKLNPDFFLGPSQRRYVEFGLTTTLNRRNTFAYPLTGRYVQVGVAYRAFLTSGSPNITVARAQYSQYFALGGDFYYNFSLQGQLRFAERVAYADNRAFGYDALVRGYDRYVINGRHYGLVQQGLSYRLLDAGRLKLGGLNNPKLNSIPLVFYLNTFVDAGYVASRSVAANNRLPNQLLSAVGVGLHLVTYYDRVLTMEYTLNGLGQRGFFFRTEFPI